MSWVAVAVAGSAVVGAVVQSDSAGKAGAAQAASGRDAIRVQNAQAGQSRADNAQFLQTGTIANQRLAGLLGLSPGGASKSYQGQLVDMSSGVPQPVAQLYATDPEYKKAWDQADAAHRAWHNTGYTDQSNAAAIENSVRGFLPEVSSNKASTDQDTINSPLLKKFSADDLNADPVYNAGLKFGLDRGTEGINSRALASGMYDSGATLKALTQFGNDYGSTKANDSYNRYTNDQSNTFNKLSGISGTGQVAVGQVASSGTNAANNVSSTMEGIGNSRAASIVGGANAWGNAGQGVTNAANNYQSNQRLNALLANYNNQPTSNFDYTGSTAAGGYQYG